MILILLFIATRTKKGLLLNQRWFCMELYSIQLFEHISMRRITFLIRFTDNQWWPKRPQKNLTYSSHCNPQEWWRYFFMTYISSPLVNTSYLNWSCLQQFFQQGYFWFLCQITKLFEKAKLKADSSLSFPSMPSQLDIKELAFPPASFEQQ